MTLYFIDFKTSEPQTATSPSVVSSGSNDSGFNDFLRQAQGLSLSKAAESNFEGKLRSCSASSPYAYRPEAQALAPGVAQFF
jgi:hypothetical protein